MQKMARSMLKVRSKQIKKLNISSKLISFCDVACPKQLKFYL